MHLLEWALCLITTVPPAFLLNHFLIIFLCTFTPFPICEFCKVRVPVNRETGVEVAASNWENSQWPSGL